MRHYPKVFEQLELPPGNILYTVHGWEEDLKNLTKTELSLPLSWVTIDNSRVFPIKDENQETVGFCAFLVNDNGIDSNGRKI